MNCCFIVFHHVILLVKVLPKNMDRKVGEWPLGKRLAEDMAIEKSPKINNILIGNSSQHKNLTRRRLEFRDGDATPISDIIIIDDDDDELDLKNNFE
ncbi:unnamed protein product, partial [Linum tenue]